MAGKKKEPTTEHDAIRDFMQRAASGEENAGRRMKYDPKQKRFVIVDEADTAADALPEVTPEDLQSFAEIPAHVVVEEAAVRAALSAGRRLGLTERDGGDLWAVGGEGDDVVVVAGGGPVPSPAPRLVLVADLAEGGAPRISARRVSGGQLGDEVPVSVLPVAPALFDRVRGVFETDVLADRTVAIAGVGSGGSFVARELAKSGVGNFILIDHDRVEVGNVCRHECGLSDLGRFKVHAVRDLLLDRNPGARVTALPLKIGGDTVAELRRALEGVDLLVVATDNRESRMILNRIAIQQKLHTLMGAVFRRAYGGQVLRVIPGLTPCYQCFVDYLPTPIEDQEVSSAATASAIAYSDRPVPIEPGLSSDLLPVALQIVKLAILHLLGDRPTTLSGLRIELVTPLYLWLNRREPGTDYAHLTPFENNIDGMSILRWYGVMLPRNASCPVCGSFERDLLDRIGLDGDLDLSVFGG